jgi:2-polyprenyl-3-methyl-5-hydroxy-6-metoxy-1,4-benzoquinol methylase
MNIANQQYWEKRLSDGLNLQNVGTLRAGHNYNIWLYRIRNHVLRRVVSLLKLKLEECSIIDLGTGTGFYVQQFCEMGATHVTGIDLTTVSVDNLKKKYPNYIFHQADIGDPLPAELLSQTYDVVTTFDVLFHIVDNRHYQQSLKNVSSLLKPDGYFIFSENFLRHATEQTAPHIKHRSRIEIKNALHQAGFEIVFQKPVFHAMNYPIDSTSQWARKAWVKAMAITRKSEILGSLLGAFLFLVDLIMVEVSKESPSTKIIVCRKSSSGQITA